MAIAIEKIKPLFGGVFLFAAGNIPTAWLFLYVYRKNLFMGLEYPLLTMLSLAISCPLVITTSAFMILDLSRYRG